MPLKIRNFERASPHPLYKRIHRVIRAITVDREFPDAWILKNRVILDTFLQGQIKFIF